MFPSYRLDHQFEVIRLVGELTDVPVPRVRWLENTGEVLGTPFFLMDHVDGIVPPDVMPYTFGDNWFADAPAEQQRELQDATVEVHRQTALNPRTRTRPSDSWPTSTRRATPRCGATSAGSRTGTSSPSRTSAAPRWSSGRSPGWKTTSPLMSPQRFRAGLGRLADRQRALPGFPAGRRAGLGNGHGRSPRAGRLVDHLRAHGLPGVARPGRNAGAARRHARGRRARHLPQSSPASRLGDLRWFYVYSGVVWCCVFMRTGARRVHFGEFEQPDDVGIAVLPPTFVETTAWRGPTDARTDGRIPGTPDTATDRLAGLLGPELLRPVLLQRPRPHRGHLPHLRHRLLPEPRREGCVPAGAARRHPDRGAPVRCDRSGPAEPERGQLPRRGQRTAAQAAHHPRRDGGHRRRPHLERPVRRRAGATAHPACGQPGHAGCPALRPIGFLEWPSGDRRRDDHRRPEGLDRQPRPVLGHPADR